MKEKATYIVFKDHRKTKEHTHLWLRLGKIY